ncbi:hypothetical protein CIK04_28995, partial [Vibrio sp. 03_296]|uniref:hypothetical protein n=1 Tax=Vibrio sp. 03_296 TaxID=2024409 RepID=UPI000BCEEA39
PERSRYLSPISKYLYDAIKAIETEKSTNTLVDIESGSKGTSLSSVVTAIDNAIKTAFEDDDYFCLDETHILKTINDDFMKM